MIPLLPPLQPVFDLAPPPALLDQCLHSLVNQIFSLHLDRRLSIPLLLFHLVIKVLFPLLPPHEMEISALSTTLLSILSFLPSIGQSHRITNLPSQSTATRMRVLLLRQYLLPITIDHINRTFRLRQLDQRLHLLSRPSLLRARIFRSDLHLVLYRTTHPPAHLRAQRRIDQKHRV